MAANVVVPPFETAPQTVVGVTPQSIFSFSFPFWAAADIIVRINGEVLDPDLYTVEGLNIQDGEPVEGGFGSGVVTLQTEVTASVVTIDRFVVAARETVFSKSAPLDTRVLNADINKLTGRQQDLQREVVAIRQEGGLDPEGLAAQIELSVAANVPTALDALLPAAIAAAVDGKANAPLDNATVQPDFDDAVSRAVYIKARESLSVDDFNDVLITDVTAITAAMDAAANDKLPLRLFKSLTIDEPLTVLDSLTLIGPRPTFAQALAGEYEDGDGVLKIADDVSVTLSSGASLTNLRAARLGMVRPTTPSQAMTARDAMLGTAFVTNAIDTIIRDSQIIGFARAIDVTGVGRVNIVNNRIDCTAGIRVVQSLDTGNIEGNHLWPFLTADQAGTPGMGDYEPLAITREGIGIEIGGAGGGIANQNDYTNILRNFTFGQKIGFQISGASHVSLIGNGADNNAQAQVLGGAPALAFAQQSIGLNIQGETRNTLVTDFRGSGNGRTLVVQPTGRSPRVEVKGFRSWSPALAHVDHTAGELVLDSAGMETPEGGAFPNGHKILIADAITSCDLTLPGPNKPAIVASNTAMAKTRVAGMSSRSETGAVLRDNQDIVRDRVSIKDFGAIGDGASHPLSSITTLGLRDTTGWTLAQWQTVYSFADSLTNEIDWCAHMAARTTGKEVGCFGSFVMGAGKSVPTATNGTIFRGIGWAGTEWVFNVTTQDGFSFTTMSRGGVLDGTIRNNGTQTAGAMVRLVDGQELFCRGVRFNSSGSDVFYAAIIGDGGANQFIYKVDDCQFKGGAYHVLVGTTSGLVQDFYLKDCVGNDATLAGVELRNVSGFFAQGLSDFIQCNVALKTNPASGRRVTAVDVIGFLCDTSDNHGAHITTDGGTVTNLTLHLQSRTNGTLTQGPTSALASGILLDEGTGIIDGVKLTGEYYNNTTCGVAIVAARKVAIDASVGYNSIVGPGNFAGIYIGPDAVDCSVTGGWSGSYGQFRAIDGKANSQTYGIQIDVGATDTIVNGVNVKGNVTGGIKNDGTRTVFGAIRGHRTKANFVWAITTGNFTSNVTVPIDVPLLKDRVVVTDGSGNRIVCSSVAGQVATFTAVAGSVASDVFFNVVVDQSEDFGATYT